MHDAANFEEFLLVMHHVSTGESGDGVIFAELNSLFVTDLLAHAAEDAANHVDIEFFRIFFNLGEPVR